MSEEIGALKSELRGLKSKLSDEENRCVCMRDMCVYKYTDMCVCERESSMCVRENTHM